MTRHHSNQQPLCAIVAPSGRRSEHGAERRDAEVMYEQVFQPAVVSAGLSPLPVRLPRQQPALTAHDHERVVLSDYALVDVSQAAPDLYVTLGVRHVVRPGRTVLVAVEGGTELHALGQVPRITYRVDHAGCTSDDRRVVEEIRRALADVRAHAGEAAGPIFRLVTEVGPPSIGRLRTDVFRDHVVYADDIKRELAAARRAGVQAVRSVHERLEPIARAESGAVIDLLLSYRSVGAWTAMIRLVAEMAEPLARMVIVREQHAFALNRAGRGDEAERLLLALLAEHGPNSETCGILGRVYKDRWERACGTGQAASAAHWLDRAIEAYLTGFEADWRDAYPGVNAATLMELAQDPRLAEILPVVTYSVRRGMAAREPDYWDYATLLELAVLRRDREAAREALHAALASVREGWELATTRRNIALVREHRATLSRLDDWLPEVEEKLEGAAGARS